MNDLLLELMQRFALECEERHDYLPNTPEEARQFRPHLWAMHAAQAAQQAAYAEGRKDQEQEAESDGRRLAPVVPTLAMIEAGKDERMRCLDTAGRETSPVSVGEALTRIYKAMLGVAA